MEILKMRFSILHTFHQISRTFYFWSDLDLAGDLDLWPWGTKFSHNIFSYVSHMCAWIESNLSIFSGDLRSKVKVTSEVKVIQKIKSAGNLMKRVENWKSHFQIFYIHLIFLVDLCMYQAGRERKKATTFYAGLKCGY